MAQNHEQPKKVQKQIRHNFCKAVLHFCFDLEWMN